MDPKLMFILLICGTTTLGINISPSIVGGSSNAQDAPWIVSLHIQNETLAYCGGTLIKATKLKSFPKDGNFEVRNSTHNAGWVVTSASCLRDWPLSNAILGRYDLTSDSGTILSIDHSKLHKHENYSSITNENDIGLFHVTFSMEGEVEVLDYKVTIEEFDYPRTTGTVYGWGLRSQEGALQTFLQNASIPLVLDKDCASFHEHDAFKPESMLCAGGNRKGPCSYDTGGPLVCQKEWSESKSICGIISFGRGCGEDREPSVFTEIQNFVGWIDGIIAE